MQFIRRLFGTQKPSAAPGRAGAPATMQQHGTRHELVKMAVRDVLKKHGIPTTWVACEILPGHTRDRIRGTHVRLVVREWLPSLLLYTVSIQRAILTRLIRIDPLSPACFAGVSWRYAVVDDNTCPALPPPTHGWQPKKADAAPDPSARDRLEVQFQAGAKRRAHEPAEFLATQPMQVG